MDINFMAEQDINDAVIEDSENDSVGEPAISIRSFRLTLSITTAPSPSLASPKFNNDNIQQLTSHTPPGERVQLRLRRRREGVGTLQKTFELWIEDGNVLIADVRSASHCSCLLRRMPLAQNVHSPYSDTICDSVSGKSVGCVKSTNFGTSFSVHETIYGQKCEIAGVIYEPNFLGHNGTPTLISGPRKMSVFIPAMQKEGDRIPIPDKSSLSSLAKARNEHVLSLHNKVPQWNDETQSFVLNFNGRVSLASVKNFQIVHDMDLEHIALQFGRVTQDEFSVDVQVNLI
jgi:tubby and related proteins